MGEKIESRVQSQVIVARETGATQGSRTRKRTSHLPLKSLTRISASAVASTTTITLAMTAKRKVFHNASRNTGSASTRRKVAHPTNSSSGLPVLISVNA